MSRRGNMKKTIKGKLTLNTAIFIVAAIIVCEIVSVNALKTNMTNQTRQYVSREAQTNARVVNEWLQGQANTVHTITNTIAFMNTKDTDHVMDYLEKALSENKEALMYYLCFGYDGGVFPANHSKLDLDPTTRDWWKQAIKKNSLIYTAPYKDFASGKMIVTIAEPLEIKGEQAVVLADITIDTLTKLVSNVSTDENIQGFLLDADGMVVSHQNKDYLTAFGMASWFPSFFPLLGGIILSAVEFFIGISLFFATRRTLATSLALMLMIFMTPLTLYLAIFDPVSDCGCFGDAWVLTNWETFGKNIVLLFAAMMAFRHRRMLVRFISVKMEWLVSLYTLFFVFTLSFYCLDRLPVLDFRPYKIGKNILEGMTMPEGAKPSVYESIFILEKNGEKKEFTLDNYPDSTWTFVDTRTILKEKGYEPAIHDFSMIDLNTGEDITDDVLTDIGYTFLLVAHRIEEADDSNIDLINEIYDYSVEHGYKFYCLTSSPEEQIELWKDKTGAEYPFCQMDDITLKTMVRSNPGLILIKNGTILNKWSDEDIPDEYVLTDKLENLPLGKQKVSSDTHTVGYVFLWFVIPLLLVLGVDVLVVRRRERKNAKRKQQEEEMKSKELKTENPKIEEQE